MFTAAFQTKFEVCHCHCFLSVQHARNEVWSFWCSCWQHIHTVKMLQNMNL